MRLRLLIFSLIFLFACTTASNWIIPWIAPTSQSFYAQEKLNDSPWDDDQEEDSNESESQEEKEKEKEEQVSNHFLDFQLHYKQLIAFQFQTNELNTPSAILLEVNTPPPKLNY